MHYMLFLSYLNHRWSAHQQHQHPRQSGVRMFTVSQMLSCALCILHLQANMYISHIPSLQAARRTCVLCSCVQPCIGEHANHCLASSQHAQYCHWNLCFLAGMHIVAMAAGYIDAPPAELVVAPRKQVLVAVTSNWQVMCFDHNLRLLWETTILVCSTVSIGIQSKPCAVAHPDCKAPFLSHARIYDCHKHPLVGA